MEDLTDKDIEWERIENPDPGGPYWQPVNPYARYFWRELIEVSRNIWRDREYSQEIADKLVSYFVGE